MLMTPMSYKKFRGLVNWYEYKTDTDFTNSLREGTTSGLHLVEKIITKYLIYLNGYHQMLGLSKHWHSSHPISFSRKIFANAPDATFTLT